MSKKLHFKSWLLMLCMLLGVGNVWAQSDYSDDYTGNVVLSTQGGSNASTCVVSINSSNYNGIKAGTAKNAGAVMVTVPANTKYLHIHAAAWSGNTVSLAVTPTGYSENVSLTADSGISNNSPFTFSGNASSDDYYKVITFSSALEDDTNLTFTATGGKRFVIWGVTAEEESSNPGDTRTTTTVTIDDSGITNTNVFEGTAAGSFSATVMAGESAVSGASVTWESETPSVATIDAASGVVTLVAAGTTKITATYAGDTSYKNSSATYTLTVTNDDPNGPGTENNPYTVAQARAAIDAGTGVTGVYATGIVSEIVTPFDSGYGNITYNISADGSTTADQLQAYRGKSYNGDWFTSEDDIQVGDEVVIYGNLTLYKGTYEFAQNNQLVSLQRTELLDNVITVTGGTEFSMDPDNNPELYLVATATSGEAVTFTLDTETTLTVDDDFIFDADNGYLLVYNEYAGTIVIKANSAATETYKAADEVTITITVIGAKQNPTITVADASVAYGSTFTVDDSVIEGGEITVTSSNEAVATVSGLVITPAAVGTTTITVATAEDATYKAGSETFTLTVMAPEGKEVAPSAAGAAVFTETFAESTGSISNNFSQSDGGGSFAADNEWSVENAYGAGAAAKFGASKKKGTATTPAISVTEGTAYTLTFKAAPWASESSTMSVTVTGGTISGISTDEMTPGEWNDYEATVTATAESLTIKFEASNNRFFLDEVVLAAPAASAVEEVTLNGFGYKTFCSEYPLDFTGDNNFTAWEMTNIATDGTITFNQITTAIKGGQGILLMGAADDTIEIPMSDGTETLYENLLEGTLAPMYIGEEEYYALSGNTFVKVHEGVVPAGKAILDATWVNVASSVKTFTFVFNSTDGIQTIEKVSAEDAARIFDLAGRRLSQTRKGVNIVNGKKILVK